MSSITNCCVKIDSNNAAVAPVAPVPLVPTNSAPAPLEAKPHEQTLNIKDFSLHFSELIESLERLPDGLVARAGAKEPLVAMAWDVGEVSLARKVRESPMFTVPPAHELDQIMAADPTDGLVAETMQDLPPAETVPVDPSQAHVDTREANAVTSPVSPVPFSRVHSTASRDSSLSPSNTKTAPNILQFSTSIFYFMEGEDTHCVINVMRLGNTPDRCSCYYETIEDSRKTDQHRYVHQKGTLVFEAEEKMKEIRIEIINDDIWCALLEFSLQLSKPEGATLGKYLWKCRVKVLDDDTFPTNKFRKEFESGTEIEKIPAVQLMIEYFKMNLHSPIVRRGTIKYVTLGQVHNLYWILQLFLTQTLVDSILSDPTEDSYDGCTNDERLLGIFECPGTTAKKEASLITWAILVIAPFALVHLFDFRVRFWKIGGTSRSTLQLNLLQKFFNYSEAVRNDLGNSEMMLAISRTSTELVSDGYMQLLPLSRDLTKILLVVGVQVYIGAVHALVPVVVFPIVLFSFLFTRSKKTHRVLKAEVDDKAGLIAHVDYCGDKLRILTDFVMRWHAVEEFEDKLKRYNAWFAKAGAVAVNNSYAAPWLSMIFVGAWFIVGGRQVIHGAPLGFFLMNLGIIKEVGNCWGKIYQIAVTMQRAFVPLREITYLMNLPTDLEDRMSLNRKRRAKGELLRAATRKSLSSGALQAGASKYAADMVPVSVEDLAFAYGKGKRNDYDFAGCLSNITFQFSQGLFVAFVGEPGGGKSTLLKLLGGVLLPQSGDLLVPPHLRVLHISQHPMFIDGTLYENLTFGIRKNDSDATPARAQAICKQLMLPEHICSHLDASNESVFNDKTEWDVVLSLSEQTLLNIARALMCNPEILILHKPTLMLNERLADNTLACLRKYVDHKGLEQDPALIEQRRPRTCIITAARMAGVRIADKVFEVEKTQVILREKEYLEGHNSLLG